ncbi:hypothetical protein HK101_006630 [Irineochytrium annulatum]|nr:hypothetical protein HK101_006630 [Irineochytrium annulatum]
MPTCGHVHTAECYPSDMRDDHPAADAAKDEAALKHLIEHAAHGHDKDFPHHHHDDHEEHAADVGAHTHEDEPYKQYDGEKNETTTVVFKERRVRVYKYFLVLKKPSICTIAVYAISIVFLIQPYTMSSANVDVNCYPAVARALKNQSSNSAHKQIGNEELRKYMLEHVSHHGHQVQHHPDDHLKLTPHVHDGDCAHGSDDL